MTQTSAAVLSDLIGRVRGHVDARFGQRVLIGIAGVPGAGKTTLARDLVESLNSLAYRDKNIAQGDKAAPFAAHVPMDGYHLADTELERLGLRNRKGAPATFDHAGYTSLLQRLRANTDDIVYAPAFDREIEQPIAGSIPILKGTRVLVSEGNYLLLDAPWNQARSYFDEVWFARVDEKLRNERLLARHIQFGKSPEQAVAWIAATDQPNAELVSAHMVRAALIIDI